MESTPIVELEAITGLLSLVDHRDYKLVQLDLEKALQGSWVRSQVNCSQGRHLTTKSPRLLSQNDNPIAGQRNNWGTTRSVVLQGTNLTDSCSPSWAMSKDTSSGAATSAAVAALLPVAARAVLSDPMASPGYPGPGYPGIGWPGYVCDMAWICCRMGCSGAWLARNALCASFILHAKSMSYCEADSLLGKREQRCSFSEIDGVPPRQSQVLQKCAQRMHFHKCLYIFIIHRSASLEHSHDIVSWHCGKRWCCDQTSHAYMYFMIMKERKLKAAGFC